MNNRERVLTGLISAGAIITALGNACGTDLETATGAKSITARVTSVSRSASGTSSTATAPVKNIVRTLKIKTLCTNSDQYALAPAKTAVNLEARVFDQANKQVLCRISGIKDQIVNQRQLTLPDSCKLADGSYVLRIAPPDAPLGQSLVETLVDPSDSLQFSFQTGDSGPSPGVPIKVLENNVFASNLRTDQFTFIYFQKTASTAAIANDDHQRRFVAGAEPTPAPAPECQRNENPPPPPPPPVVDYGGYTGGDGGGDGGDGAAAPVVKGK